MQIKRIISDQEVNITLTQDEIADAHKEFIVNFFISELISNYNDEIPEEKNREIACAAYDIYCKGEGLTEYDSLREAIYSYLRSV